MYKFGREVILYPDFSRNKPSRMRALLNKLLALFWTWLRYIKGEMKNISMDKSALFTQIRHEQARAQELVLPEFIFLSDNVKANIILL